MTATPGWVAAIIASSMATTSSKHHCDMKVTALNRYAVKGLSADALDSVNLETNCFPDDRRFALLQKGREWKEGEWLHKENFLCAFTNPQLLAQFESSYRVLVRHDEDIIEQRILELRDRASGKLLAGPLQMDLEDGREKLADFLSEQSGEEVVCVTSRDGAFQFGNTSSGVKNGDTNARSIHIVFQATVDALQKKIGVPLNPTRFRPNIVLQSNAAAWSEFNWIGKTLEAESSGLKLKVVNKTVRCKGVSVDPLDPDRILDIPELLITHFPEHGPFLGIYCMVEREGRLSLGDKLRLLN